MNIVGFSEGARGEFAGIISVPSILASAAAEGHNAVLVLCGQIPPGKERYVVSNPEQARSRREGKGSFGAICLRTWSSWLFNAAIFWRFRKLVRDADFVSLHSLYSFPVLAGYLLAKFYGKPYGIWPHSVLAPVQRGISVRKKLIYNGLFVNRMLRDATVIFYTARGEREETEDLKLRQLSVVIPDGFDGDEFAELAEKGRFRERFLGGHKGPLILFLARIHAKKSPDVLIQAMGLLIKERPEARLAIVGPPDPPAFMEKVREWIQEAGVEGHTIITGNANAQMRLEAFTDADMYVLPSQAENFGFSVFEAMACGVPVVVSNAINYASEIAESGAGFSLQRTPEAFASAMKQLIDDPARRSAMGARGREFSRRYPVKDTGRKLANTIDSIVRQKQPPPEVFPIRGSNPTTIASESERI